MGPFSPASVASTRVTVGVASANIQLLSSGRQAILVTPATNVDSVYVEFGATNAIAAVVPVAAGARGGLEIIPNAMVEITIPSGLSFMAHISGTAAQKLTICEGGDI